MSLEADKPIRLTVWAQTDVGRSREHNEDWFLLADLCSGATGPTSLSCELGRKGAIALVADGMGGAVGGEVASRTASDLIYRALREDWSRDSDSSPERFAASVRRAVEDSNRELYQRARSQSELRGMGTTATIAGFLGARVLLNQVGDSRAYLIRGNAVVQLTRDQSIVQALVDGGGLTEEEARRMVPKNVLLQALGPDPSVDVVQSWQTMAHEDLVLLCSDGLSGVVSPAEIGAIVVDAPDLKSACQGLIDLANSRGGRDNITVLLAQVAGDGRRPRPLEGARESS